MDRRRLTLLLGLTCVTLLGGCSHYGFAANAPGADEDPVAVWTVASPAHQGLDRDRLTRGLVDVLHGRGLSGARWTGQDDVALSIRCSVVTADSEAFGVTVDATAALRCTALRGNQRATFDAAGQAAGDIEPAATRSVATRRTQIIEAAALEAAAEIAPEIARWFSRHQD